MPELLFLGSCLRTRNMTTMEGRRARLKGIWAQDGIWISNANFSVASTTGLLGEGASVLSSGAASSAEGDARRHG